MKALIASILLASACLVFSGCETDPAAEVGAKFERGIRGEGTVYENDDANDPIIRERSHVGR